MVISALTSKKATLVYSQMRLAFVIIWITQNAKCPEEISSGHFFIAIEKYEIPTM